MPKLVNNLDFNKYEARNVRLQNLAAAPSAPVKGQLYFDTANNQGWIYNGTAWKPLGSEGTVTSVTGTAPVTSSGGTTPAIGITAATSGAAGSMSAADKGKIDGIAAGATANQTNAFLVDRANHTGAQAIATVTNLQSSLDAKIATSLIGANNGLATLDGGGKVPNTQLPAIGLTDVSVVADITARNALTVQEGDVAIVTSTAQTFIYDGATWQLIQTPIDGVTAVTGTGPIASTGGNTPQIAITADSITAAYLAGNAVGVSELSSAVAGAGLTGGSNSALAVGQGAGISVTADAIAIDTASVVQKYVSNIGDGTGTSFTILHMLGTKDVTTSVYKNASPFEEVLCDVEHMSANQTTFKFADPPASAEYRVVIHG